MSPPRFQRRLRTWLPFLLIVTAIVCAASSLYASETEHTDTAIGARLPLWSTIPFVGILLSIALFPLFAPSWWHHHFPKVSAFWALLFAVPFVISFHSGAIDEILHVYFLEYIPFILLLWALFTISGGVHVRGTLSGAPGLNTGLIAIGTIVASWVGTTGASMIFIRPVLRANEWRRHKVHTIIFFIFLVSNIGGSLTPLGDPPLFLGFLHGVPFFWTMHLLPHMSLVAVPLLVAYYFIDRFFYRRETPTGDTKSAPVGIYGWHNLFFLAGVVGAVLASGVWHPGHLTLLGVHVAIESICREGFLILMAALSLATTKKAIHEANGFSWFPIKEVAYLFAGIFMTIIPCLAILKAGAEGKLHFLMALQHPYEYFWVTGSLSSFLDNAPSYLTFFNSLLGKFFVGVPQAESVGRLIAERHLYLVAISTGAVFMGAMTYIGNAPNFMVRSIAEEAGIRMPSFFGYMMRYSIPILIPLFVLVNLIFL